jgi:hypothetical protein
MISFRGFNVAGQQEFHSRNSGDDFLCIFAVASAADLLAQQASVGCARGRGIMIYAALIAASLIVPASFEPNASLGPDRGVTMSPEQKDATLRPLVSSATECIARTVSADPRFQAAPGGAALNNLIVESVPSCVTVLRSMIDTYDRLYGEGEGETFFTGPYLDGLPAAVTRRVKNAR